MELGKAGYTAQIGFYLKNNEFEKAYDLSKEFVSKFPDEMVPHFLLSQSAFERRLYDEAIGEGSRAFNKSVSDDDMLACAILTGSAYYMTGRYAEGIKLLKSMELKKTNQSLESLLFILSIAIRDGK
jgi:tetratricopeptide (TPR) repeat protein